MPSESGFVPPLRVELLGGFHVERIGVARPVVWQRRSATTLTKLLAAHPRHSLHREEILELLWPSVPAKSALNRFGQALHAARRALEPELQPRECSAYLRLTECVLFLETEHVAIDADQFQQLAESAIGRGNEEAYESALAAYGGELLPEDRYHDWCAERRAFLAELRIRLLVELADTLDERGAQAGAIDRLREVLRYDPTREDVHRRLIALYAGMGARDQAARQFQTCREVLQRDLGLLPAGSTLALYEQILADQTAKPVDAPTSDREVVEPVRAAAGPTPRAMNDPAASAPRKTRAGQWHGGRRKRSARSGTGFLIFRVAWVTAILASGLVFLVGLFSGGDSSQQRADVASAPPAAPVVGGEGKKKAQKTGTGPQDGRSRLAKKQASGDGHSTPSVPRGSAAEPGDAGGRAPVGTPQPTAPLPAPRPKPAPSPRPNPTPAPPQVPVSSQPAPSEPAQTTVIIANNNTGSP